MLFRKLNLQQLFVKLYLKKGQEKFTTFLYAMNLNCFSQVVLKGWVTEQRQTGGQFHG